MNTSEHIRNFNEIYKLYHEKCVMFAQSYIHDLPQAQDIVADAMIVLWEKLQTGEEIHLPLPFLLQVVRNKVLQHFRSIALHNNVADNMKCNVIQELELRLSSLKECDPYEYYLTEVNELIEKSLSEMSEKTRAIFSLSRYESKQHKEIALRFGLSVKSVEYHINQALKKLRKDLGDYMPLL